MEYQNKSLNIFMYFSMESIRKGPGFPKVYGKISSK